MILRLAEPSSQAWLDCVLAEPGVLLLDHAHCEKKAASTAISLIFRYQDRPELMRPLSELAREELEHFEQVLGLMEARGLRFGPLEPGPYAARLRKACRKAEPERLVDTLLCCAFIEARSCERMQLLADHHPDAELRALYQGLLESEARHHAMYLGLARAYADRDSLSQRLAELAVVESAALDPAPSLARFHS